MKSNERIKNKYFRRRSVGGLVVSSFSHVMTNLSIKFFAYLNIHLSHTCARIPQLLVFA